MVGSGGLRPSVPSLSSSSSLPAAGLGWTSSIKFHLIFGARLYISGFGQIEEKCKVITCRSSFNHTTRHYCLKVEKIMSEIIEEKRMPPDHCAAANTHIVEIRKFYISVAGKFLEFLHCVLHSVRSSTEST